MTSVLHDIDLDTASSGEVTNYLYARLDPMLWAEVWAHYARAIQERGEEVIDEGWIIGWFANAFEAQKAQWPQE
jgi:hypothetical protein